MNNLDKAIQWVKKNTIANEGIRISTKHNISYPEVSGYFIPTLIQIGEIKLATQYSNWLVRKQADNGSFGLGKHKVAFDTGQVMRGWNELVPFDKTLEPSLKKACVYLDSITLSDGSMQTPKPGTIWCLPNRGEVSPCIMLNILKSWRDACNFLSFPFIDPVIKATAYYVDACKDISFEDKTSHLHFYSYIIEGLIELDQKELARKLCKSVLKHQRKDGSIPCFADVSWVSSVGMFQMAKNLFLLDMPTEAIAVFNYAENLQNDTGGFYGSYGLDAPYFAHHEISWAVKYYIDAYLLLIKHHFNSTVGIYSSTISETDDRVRVIEKFFGDMSNKTLLDAGCGKGRYSNHLHKKYPDCRITAMDISSEMLKSVDTGIQKIEGSLLNIPFGQETFDFVICVEALEHAVQINAAVAELVRVLKPGGNIIIIDKNIEQLGKLKMPVWEKWFSCDAMSGLLSSKGVRTSYEFVGYNNRKANGLFVCWKGIK